MTLFRPSRSVPHRRAAGIAVPDCRLTRILVFLLLLAPAFAFAGSPFATGATALTANVITIITPLAVIGVIAIGVAAWFNKVAWGWAVAAIIGIVLVFGAQQIVTWIRGMFGV